MDIIFGVHAIIEAINNPLRTGKKLYSTPETLAKWQREGLLKQDLSTQWEIVEKTPHSLQEEAKKLCLEQNFQFKRVPSHAFLTAHPLPERDLRDLYQRIKNPPCRLILLDQVTDVHNLAAILRTAAFYNVSAVVVSRKGGINLSPGFFRVSSGAVEHVPLINVTNLSRTVKQLREKGVTLLGLSQDASKSSPENFSPETLGLVLGAEENGLSHAVQRALDCCYALKNDGPLKGLNVSVAAAVAMEKFFGN